MRFSAFHEPGLSFLRSVDRALPRSPAALRLARASSLEPARAAAGARLQAADRRTSPRSVISPVIATSARTGCR